MIAIRSSGAVAGVGLDASANEMAHELHDCDDVSRLVDVDKGSSFRWRQRILIEFEKGIDENNEGVEEPLDVGRIIRECEGVRLA